MVNKNIINVLLDMRNNASSEYEKSIITTIKDLVVDLRRVHNKFNFGQNTDEIILVTLAIIICKLDPDDLHYFDKILHELAEKLEVDSMKEVKS